MKNFKNIAAVAAALATAVTLSGCAASDISDAENGTKDENYGVQAPIEGNAPTDTPDDKPTVDIEIPQVLTVSYVNVLSDGVNIRSGAGTDYSVRGSAQKATMYALNGSSGGWYKTGYKNKPAYISNKYCEVVEMESSGDEKIEAIINEGTKLLGTAYVYGAVRYHDGNGKLLSGFKTSAFDCSSLMQYIFYKGAGVNLQLTTRTQIYQGKTVKKSQLQRGDLMFFTNESRKDNVGVERVGHVALYLGDNWILHTASDYAKIEQISAKRWSFFIQGQRIF